MYGRMDYDLLMSSGLYDRLTKEQYLIPHSESNEESPEPIYKIIVP